MMTAPYTDLQDGSVINSLEVWTRVQSQTAHKPTPGNGSTAVTVTQVRLQTCQRYSLCLSSTFPVELWNIYQHTWDSLPRTNNGVEGSHNTTRSSVITMHPRTVDPGTTWGFGVLNPCIVSNPHITLDSPKATDHNCCSSEALLKTQSINTFSLLYVYTVLYIYYMYILYTVLYYMYILCSCDKLEKRQR